MIETSFLSDFEQEIVLGSLLGDGSLKIMKDYRNARFSFRHSIKQADYFWWKAKQLKNISGEKFAWEQAPDGLGGKKLRYQSAALPALTELYKLVCHKGQLRIRRRWLNKLTARSLAIWWLDDGSIITNGRRGVICTDGFDLKSVQLLAQYLQVVWKINVHIGPIKRVRDDREFIYYRLWLRSSKELQKFLTIILPYVPVASMLEKVLLLYRNFQLQQRWISEVQTATGFSKAIIEQAVASKKERWQQFRE